MKKFFKKLKDKFSKKSKEDQINSELSDAYNPEDFDEKTGEYELSQVQFDESTGQYSLEDLQESTQASGDTLAELLKKARETDANEVLDEDELAEDEDDFFDAETLDVASLKEKYQEGEEEVEGDLPDFPSTPDLPTAPDFSEPPAMNLEPEVDTDDIPELEPEVQDEEEVEEEVENLQFDDPEDIPEIDTLNEIEEDIEEDLNDIDSDNHYPENIQDIPAEFNQDVREHLTSETELPSPEPTITRAGIIGVLDKLKQPETYKKLAQKTESKVGSLNLPDQFASLFSPQKRPAVHRAFIWSMTLGISAILGQIIGNFFVVDQKDNAQNNNVAMRMPPDNLNNDLRVFYENDLFKPAEHERDQKAVIVDQPKEPKKVLDLKSKCSIGNAKQKSSAPVTLTNTIVLQDSVKSIASVSIRGTKSDMVFREGDEIKDAKTRIDHIENTKLILKNLESGECEYISIRVESEKSSKKIKPIKILSPSKGKKLLENKDMDTSIQNEGNKYSIKKEERNKLLSNLDELLTQALAVQIKNPDGSLSFKLTEIVPGSFYTKIGIQNGDIIKTINGKPITNMNQVMSLFGKISEIDQFQLGVLRGGSVINKEYNFE